MNARQGGGPTLFDTHCHLTFDGMRDDLEGILARAAAAGVETIVTIGIDPASCGEAVSLARAVAGRRAAGEALPRVLASVGVHPQDAGRWGDESRALLRRLAADPLVAAFGETGLDYYRDHAPRAVQRKAFEGTLELAREFNRPVVVHIREALEDALDILEGFYGAGAPAGAARGVLHCFSGTARHVERGADIGFFFGFGGTLTYKNAPVEAVRAAPRDRLVLETDAPFLTPLPHKRNSRNESSYLPLMAAAMGTMLGLRADEAAALTTANARRLYRLAVLVVAVAALHPGPAAAVPGGPTLAVEDTLDAPITSVVPEVLVQAERVPLDEILRRVAEGEARRDSLMEDQTFTLLAKVLYLDEKKDGGEATRVVDEQAARVYLKRPDRRKVVPLRDTRPDEDAEVKVEVRSSLGEEMVSFAFQPDARARYLFRILDRAFVGGHLIYHIGFEPRSRVDPLPAGEVWVDTNDFVIVREEFWYRERSPAPLFVQRIERCVIERTQVDGRWWVVERILGRATLSSLARAMSGMMKSGPIVAVDFSIWQTDWKVNAGLADSLFTGKEGS